MGFWNRRERIVERLADWRVSGTHVDASAELNECVGNPSEEVTAGLYSITGPRLPKLDWKMRDFQPIHWPEKRRDYHPERCEQKREREEERFQDEADLEIRDPDNDRRYREKLCAMQNAKIEIHEEG